MVKAQKYVVMKRFQGLPKRSDFKIVDFELPALKDGEILVKTNFISVDPYLRVYYENVPVPYDQLSLQVGTIQESKNPDFPIGAAVVSHKGWCTFYVANPNTPPVAPPHIIYKLPDFKGLSISHGVGALGMPGVSAYFGFLEVCKPKPGETVVVTGAAGAVGYLVGQIAKIKGCRVIGFAGSDDKVEWLEKELGFDKAINYKTADIEAALKQAAPKGVDSYFDNVGGEISSTIIRQINVNGRVCVFGSISSYNDDPDKMPKATIIQPSVVINQLKIEGLLVYTYQSRWFEALSVLADWITSGHIKAREHVTEGFDKVFDAFVGMLTGENFGKAVVKV